MTNQPEKEWWREFNHQCTETCIENGENFALCLNKDEVEELIAEATRRGKVMGLEEAMDIAAKLKQETAQHEIDRLHPYSFVTWEYGNRQERDEDYKKIGGNEVVGSVLIELNSRIQQYGKEA